MLRSSVPSCAALGLCLVTAACAAPTNSEQATLGRLGRLGRSASPPPEIEAPLSLSVDALDVRHGMLRIEASMEDGSPDVSVWLGDSCEAREVGHGIATRAGFAWSLSSDDIARASQCSLVVKVHAVDDDGRRVLRFAALPVAISLEEDTAESVHLVAQSKEGATTTLSFASPVRARRLHVAGSVIGAQDDEDDTARPETFVSKFEVDDDDLARAMVEHRRLSLLGQHFLATITIADATLDVSDPAPPEPDTLMMDDISESSGCVY